MSLASDFVAGVKPRLITRLTSGTGIFVPTVDMARCLVRVQAGGAGGGSGTTNGGGAGAMVEAWLRIPIAGVSYTVGAAVAAAVSGNKSFFDTLVAQAGAAGTSNYGGQLGCFVSGATLSYSGGMPGIAGGAGGQGTAGLAIGWAIWTNVNANSGNSTADATRGGGGDSFFGKGGNGNNSGVGVAGNGYGSGGGAGSTTGGAGAGGLIEILDYGV